jgi:hypothetical protein
MGGKLRPMRPPFYSLAAALGKGVGDPEDRAPSWRAPLARLRSSGDCRSSEDEPMNRGKSARSRSSSGASMQAPLPAGGIASARAIQLLRELCFTDICGFSAVPEFFVSMTSLPTLIA